MRNLKLCITLFAVGAGVLLWSPLRASADTVTLELISAGSNSAGGFDAYPYYFSVSGGPGTTPLMCLGYYNGINFNESWRPGGFSPAAWLAAITLN